MNTSFKASLLLLGMLLITSCSTNEEQSRIEVRIVFDDQVATPPIERAKIRLIEVADDGSGGLRTLTSQLIEEPAAGAFNFDVFYDLSQTHASVFLNVQLYFSSQLGPYRKSLNWYAVTEETTQVLMKVEDVVELAQSGFFLIPQTYVHHIFESDEACETSQGNGGFFNCAQWMTFDANGGVEVVVTDIVNSGTYHLDGEEIVIDLPQGAGDISGRARFGISSDYQLILSTIVAGEIWVNTPAALEE